MGLDIKIFITWQYYSKLFLSVALLSMKIPQKQIFFYTKYITPYKMLYKTSLDEFHVLDFTQKRVRRPKIYENVHLVPLYITVRAITEKKYKDIKDLLLYIYQKYFKSFKTQSSISKG